MNEWPEVIYEDALDADYIEDPKSPTLILASGNLFLINSEGIPILLGNTHNAELTLKPEE